MSKFKKTALVVLLAEGLLLLLCNLLFARYAEGGGQRPYRVEAGRVAERLRDTPPEQIDLTEFATIVSVSEFHGEACHDDYVVENVGGTLYRIAYRAQQGKGLLICMNVSLLCMMALTAFVLGYVHRKVLTPFDRMQQLPAELAKGNLAVPVREEKSKLFGRFLWGMDMLRESLEEKRERELTLHRERQTLLLSLSHDVKTPLSAIELYVKALAEGLYDTEEERAQALEGISRNVREMKSYVDEITRASREDFLNLEVREGTFYLSEAVSLLRERYGDKLAARHTEFIVEQAEDCLLKGDLDRVAEVLQNFMENAVKYGDGRRIAISFDREEDCCLITVENTGTLPEEKELPHLFDSFYRGSNHGNQKGSGLGLYICKGLMRKMDGDVFVKVREGTFRVTAVVRKA